MSGAEERELMEGCKVDCEHLDGRGGVQVQMSSTTLMALVGAAELALRHPEFAKLAAAAQVREWILNIKDQVEQAGYPDLASCPILKFPAGRRARHLRSLHLWTWPRGTKQTVNS